MDLGNKWSRGTRLGSSAMPWDIHPSHTSPSSIKNPHDESKETNKQDINPTILLRVFYLKERSANVSVGETIEPHWIVSTPSHPTHGIHLGSPPWPGQERNGTTVGRIREH